MGSNNIILPSILHAPNQTTNTPITQSNLNNSIVHNNNNNNNNNNSTNSNNNIYSNTTITNTNQHNNSININNNTNANNNNSNSTSTNSTSTNNNSNNVNHQIQPNHVGNLQLQQIEQQSLNIQINNFNSVAVAAAAEFVNSFIKVSPQTGHDQQLNQQINQITSNHDASNPNLPNYPQLENIIDEPVKQSQQHQLSINQNNVDIQNISHVMNSNDSNNIENNRGDSNTNLKNDNNDNLMTPSNNCNNENNSNNSNNMNYQSMQKEQSQIEHQNQVEDDKDAKSKIF